jgi:hypothetical protein
MTGYIDPDDPIAVDSLLLGYRKCCEAVMAEVFLMPDRVPEFIEWFEAWIAVDPNVLIAHESPLYMIGDFLGMDHKVYEASIPLMDRYRACCEKLISVR